MTNQQMFHETQLNSEKMTIVVLVIYKSNGEKKCTWIFFRLSLLHLLHTKEVESGCWNELWIWPNGRCSVNFFLPNFYVYTTLHNMYAAVQFIISISSSDFFLFCWPTRNRNNIKNGKRATIFFRAIFLFQFWIY